MSKAGFVAKGILRLVVTVLACMILAAIGYIAIIAYIELLPPHAVQ